MSTLFHVTSVLNRQSIMAHGLDWNRMGASPGIAGSSEAEEAGAFLCPDSETADFFVRVNNTGDPVDVWVVTGIDSEQLVTTGSGFNYFPDRIPPEHLRLLHRDVVAAAYPEESDNGPNGYRSDLTITFDDGTRVYRVNGVSSGFHQ